MASKTINISLDEELIKKIDKAAKAEYSSRSDFIRSSVVEKITAKQGEPRSSIDNDYAEFIKQYGQTLKNLADR
ncbi:MAG TPA: ribbon-helix-helix domain-containing protein [Verrucomicrobiae bacterium]|nr:ribbon-helix-helix domain-containing protein [Verrucomicrobiae bacterium]